MNLEDIFDDYMDAVEARTTLHIIRKMLRNKDCILGDIRNVLGVQIENNNPFGEGDEK